MSLPEIVSASRRTDVPAFHARWFVNRVRAGWCHWIHPYTAAVRRLELGPDRVVAFVFWTRQPSPLLPHVAALRADGYPLLFHFTITGYGPPLETHNSPPDRAVVALERLAALVGPDAVLWRYDPIVLSGTMTPEWHEERFARMAARLEGATRRCTVSFVDFYGKTERNLGGVERETGAPFARPDAGEKAALARRLAPIAATHGMSLLSCCDDSLVGGGVGKARCIDPDAVAAVRGGDPPAIPARPTRPDCGCVRSVDLGSYDTCVLGCRYCYATSSRAAARRRLAEADPADSVLWRPPSLRGVDLEDREIRG